MKSKLGVSVGLLGAVLYFLGMMNNYTVLLLAVGYVLIAEENPWLKKTAVKVFGICLAATLLSTCIGFISDATGLVDAIFRMFGGYFHVEILSRIENLLYTYLNVGKRVLLFILGIKALKQATIRIPVLDDFLDKAM